MTTLKGLQTISLLFTCAIMKCARCGDEVGVDHRTREVKHLKSNAKTDHQAELSDKDAKLIALCEDLRNTLKNISKEDINQILENASAYWPRTHWAIKSLKEFISESS